MEYSSRYGDADITALAKGTGYEIVAEYHDSRTWFTNSLWRFKQ